MTRTDYMTCTGGTALRLIRQLAELFANGAQPGQCREREWASATFSGARHSFEFNLPLLGAEAPVPAVLATLPDHEFALRGEIVADCTVTTLSRFGDGAGRYWLPVIVDILTVTAE